MDIQEGAYISQCAPEPESLVDPEVMTTSPKISHRLYNMSHRKV